MNSKDFTSTNKNPHKHCFRSQQNLNPRGREGGREDVGEHGAVSRAEEEHTNLADNAGEITLQFNMTF